VGHISVKGGQGVGKKLGHTIYIPLIFLGVSILANDPIYSMLKSTTILPATLPFFNA